MPRCLRLLPALLCAALLALPARAAATPATVPGASLPGLPASRAVSPTPARGRVLPAVPLSGATRLVRGEDGATVVWAEGRMGRPSALTPEGILSLLEPLSPALGLRSARAELVVEAIEKDALGMHHVPLRRVTQGLPVPLSQLVLHFDAGGELVVLNGHYVPGLPLLPTVKPLPTAELEERATRAALERARRRGWDGPPRRMEDTQARLVAWPSPLRRAVELTLSFAPHLAWKAYVDVATGEVLALMDQVRTDSAVAGSGTDNYGRSRTLQLTHHSAQGVYGTLDSSLGTTFLRTANMKNSTQGTGSLVTSTTSTIADRATVDVHANIRQVYDYFRNTHQRQSWDGQGANLVALVHYGASYNNAFWYNGTMSFGDGDGRYFRLLSRCLDIAGHEVAHGVVEGTAGLVYENQPGALNEHFADVFGALTENANWQIGEDCAGPDMGRTALRDMANPSAMGQPGHMDQYQSLPNTEDGDYGGVHTNSGIPNRAAVLVANALGKPMLGRIWYRILAQRYLTERSQFADLRRAALRACADLQPSAGCSAVGSAFDSVGLHDAGGSSSGCPANSHVEGEYCVCDAGYTVNAEGTGCEPEATLSCPANSQQVGDACYCNDGYVPDSSGTSCVPERTSCPVNSHREGDTCVCDDGFQGSPDGLYGCEPLSVVCPPNSRPSELEEGVCQCFEGWVPNSAGDGCEPGNSGCGEETFYGRCVGDTLVWCEEEAIRVGDCSGSGLACGLQSEEVGYNCVQPSAACGGLSYEGACEGNEARWCQDGEVRSLDCGDNGCGYQGEVLGYFCSPCPQNASLVDDACYCNEGYQISADGERCVPSGSTGGGGGGGGGGGSGGKSGCSAAGLAPGGMGALLLAGLVLLRARRRRAGALVLGLTLGTGCAAPAVYQRAEEVPAARAPAPEAPAPQPVHDASPMPAPAHAHVHEASPAPPSVPPPPPGAVHHATPHPGPARPPPGRPLETPPLHKGPTAPGEAEPHPSKRLKVRPHEAPHPAGEERVVLRQGQTWRAPDGHASVQVQRLERKGEPCPQGVRCVWSGVVERVTLRVRTAGHHEDFTLQRGQERQVGTLSIRAEGVQPHEATLSIGMR